MPTLYSANTVRYMHLTKNLPNLSAIAVRLSVLLFIHTRLAALTARLEFGLASSFLLHLLMLSGLRAMYYFFCGGMAEITEHDMTGRLVCLN